MSDIKNIYQRINSVMKTVEYVKKDTVIQNSYSAVTHDMVTAVLRKEFVRHGIVVKVIQTSGELLQEKAPKADGEKGHKMHLYSGSYNVHFVNIDNPEDFAVVTVFAHANDSGDKAPGKCMSYAVKYAMLKTFSLETGENEESRFADPYTSEQFEIYHDLLDSEKAYEFYLFIATLPDETITGLVNSFPEGKKTAGKKKAATLEDEGNGLFKQTVENIQQMIANQDPAVIEITDEMGALEKRFLMKRLSDFEIRQLARFKNGES